MSSLQRRRIAVSTAVFLTCILAEVLELLWYSYRRFHNPFYFYLYLKLINCRHLCLCQACFEACLTVNDLIVFPQNINDSAKSNTSFGQCQDRLWYKQIWLCFVYYFDANSLKLDMNYSSICRNRQTCASTPTFVFQNHHHDNWKCYNGIWSS